MVSFDYKYVPINQIAVTTVENKRTGQQQVDRILVEDEPLHSSNRFWVSLMARFQFNGSIFRYFDYPEVLGRISERAPNDRVRVCIERDEDGNGKLLGASNPTRPVVIHDDLMELLDRYEGESVNYSNGVVESTHVPRVTNNFDVGGDLFSHRFLLSSPIDGYGAPSIYLSLLRQVCANGMIGYSRQFKSTLALGSNNDDARLPIVRALDGFNSDEGYAVMRQRIESATRSWLSVNESSSLRRLLINLHNDRQLDFDSKQLDSPGFQRWLAGDARDAKGSPVARAFDNLTGDTSQLYGLANLDALSIKRQRTLPVRCTVYDGINFATELATHYAKPDGARRLQAWSGTLISDEFDLESTKDHFGDFADFHVRSTLATPELTG